MKSKDNLIELCKELGVPTFRAKQVLQAIYKEGKNSYADIAVLPKEVREIFTERAPIFCFTVEREVKSPLGNTVKTLFKLPDGALIEGVLMRFSDGRNSVCISSQVGCGLKCSFCSTGTMGFKRNLTAEEISDQVLYFDQLLKKENTRVDHIVFMGMGEPMLNYDNVMTAIRTFNDPDCLHIAARHITVSTSGVVPGIKKFMKEPLQINLAVSLHAPNQALRESFMPIAKAYKLDELMATLQLYMETTKRRVSYEYVMLKNINDSPEIAQQLAQLIKGQLCHVNLIPYNETYLGFSNAGKSRIDTFRQIVESYDVPVTVRVSLGQDISAACGQLAAKETKETGAQQK
ncbi:23S rRNA (adenine(2503)-C(2))-methyltransferase RlmN [Candidatus Gracilibacteria bacterium]|nr:23S rRNA (adenine(2503)-C(2))-methyltransferase RlmN [Candidatus Gracilibacteria bacterium]